MQTARLSLGRIQNSRRLKRYADEITLLGHAAKGIQYLYSDSKNRNNQYVRQLSPGRRAKPQLRRDGC
jgi:hypothetical protein